MSEVLADEEGPAEDDKSPVTSRAGRRRDGVAVGLIIAALGVVYGDIGTSPLYAFKTVLSLDGGVIKPTTTDVYGLVSLVFWSISIVVATKYVIFVLRADNNGEGGVMALAALLRRSLGSQHGRRASIVMAIGVAGAALFYGDGVITPSISVLSAVEGLKVATPGVHKLVLPIAVAILVVLFGAQRWGTARIGRLFGPVMMLWFFSLAAAGLSEIVPHPSILRGLSPSYAINFIVDDPHLAFIAMGGVVLVVTGAEALYADLGHFGARPIRRAWFVLVFPALTLAYLGQGALILRRPSDRSDPFFLLLPHWAQLPMVVLATVATVIASQAVISGAFSVSRQAVRLGFLPHVAVRHTSDDDPGQVYVPAINALLFVAVLAVTIGFGSSTRLATAYGVAVTGTLLITTSLLIVVGRLAWSWPIWQLAVMAIGFGGIELAFFAANLSKIITGGWLPLVVALAVFTVMSTWQRGRGLVSASRLKEEGTLNEFLTGLDLKRMTRVPGLAVYPHTGDDTTPIALRVNVERNQALHEQVVIIIARTADVPHVPADERLAVDHLGRNTDGIVTIDASFGFQDRPDIPMALEQAAAGEMEGTLEIDDALYFLSGVTLERSVKPGMAQWRKMLFIALTRQAPRQADQLCLPDDRTTNIGTRISI